MPKNIDIETFWTKLKSTCDYYDYDEILDFYEELLETGSVEIKDLESGNFITFTIKGFEIEGNKEIYEIVNADVDEDPQTAQKCRVCGCTQERACPGGCYWVESDLCSSCVQDQIEISFSYFKYFDESSDRVEFGESIGLASDFNYIEEAEAFIHGYATALGLESAFENEAEEYPCITIEFVISVNGNNITELEFYYEGEI